MILHFLMVESYAELQEEKLNNQRNNLRRPACMHACLVTSVMSNSATLWTIAHQALLSTGFSRQEYWSGSVTMPSSEGCSRTRDQSHISCVSCTAWKNGPNSCVSFRLHHLSLKWEFLAEVVQASDGTPKKWKRKCLNAVERCLYQPIQYQWKYRNNSSAKQ